MERKNRHMLDVARALRFEAGLPIAFWGECVLTAGYLINRVPSKVLQSKMPYEMLFKKVPSYAHLYVFGSLCYAHNHSPSRDKFDERDFTCIFLGYPARQKGWCVYDLKSCPKFVSRDVKFCDDIFPYKLGVSVSSSKRNLKTDIEPFND